MTAYPNPFAPTFGTVPCSLAGRDHLISDVLEGLRNRPGDPNRTALFIGAHGRDKTALLTTIAESSGGHAHLIQLLGCYLLLQHPSTRLVTEDDARVALRQAMHEMACTVFLPTIRRLTTRKLRYLQAMAKEDDSARTSAIARAMNVSVANASNTGRLLIERGIIQRVRRGYVAFEIPLLRAWLRQGTDL